MKANEAPEKVYLFKNPITETPDDRWLSKRSCNDDIEYVRKDAVIEKAVKFMEKIDDVDEYSWYNEEEHAAGITEKCIEDFKKYMGDKLWN